MSEIAISPSMTDYFRGILAEAMTARQLQASEAAERYLVQLLCDYAHPREDAGSHLKEPLTFLLRDAMDATGAERFRKLRSLGDGVLYGAGFFAQSIELRGASRTYVLDVGSTAYDQAASMLRLGGNGAAGFRGRHAGASGPGVLAELSTKFAKFVDVLSDVADGTLARAAKDERSVVKLYERWLRTGSSRIAEDLGARGLAPSRGPRGIA